MHTIINLMDRIWNIIYKKDQIANCCNFQRDFQNLNTQIPPKYEHPVQVKFLNISHYEFPNPKAHCNSSF